jgi:hypothetical protein
MAREILSKRNFLENKNKKYDNNGGSAILKIYAFLHLSGV